MKRAALEKAEKGLKWGAGREAESARIFPETWEPWKHWGFCEKVLKKRARVGVFLSTSYPPGARFAF